MAYGCLLDEARTTGDCISSFSTEYIAGQATHHNTSESVAKKNQHSLLIADNMNFEF